MGKSAFVYVLFHKFFASGISNGIKPAQEEMTVSILYLYLPQSWRGWYCCVLQHQSNDVDSYSDSQRFQQVLQKSAGLEEARLAGMFTDATFFLAFLYRQLPRTGNVVLHATSRNQHKEFQTQET